MENYRLIKNKEQYEQYCRRVMELVALDPTEAIEEELETIEVFIEKWEKDNYNKKSMDPVKLLKYLMENRNMSQIELSEILEVDKSYVSLIINYKKGLSKSVIRKLAEIFKVSQEAFNRPYELVSPINRGHRNEKLMNVRKELEIA
jgi:HTH-type transcriptional regulator / antitoxin HigA